MMRFLKILLIIFPSIILLSLLYAIWEQIVAEVRMTIPMYAKISLVLAILLSAITILYHIKSFRFYRRAAKQHLDKKLPKFLWIGTLSFSVLLVFLSSLSIYNKADRYLNSRYKVEDILILGVFALFAFFGFLEVITLQKRIKRLHEIRDAKDEITDIGNSTL